MKYNPKDISVVLLDGCSLVFEEFIAAARYGAKVVIDPDAYERMRQSRALVDKIQSDGRIAYGITTGFGDLQKVSISPEMRDTLSTNLILSHCTATGEPYSEEIVRGMMILRANNLLVGLSGVRPLLVEILMKMLNKGVTPVVPCKGSLGASGDLAPLAHMTLPILGLGEAMYNGEVLPGAEAMRRASIKTVPTLLSKEGLGMTNGTCAMTSVGAIACYDTICAAEMADVISSMTIEGLTGIRSAFDERIHKARGHVGQITVAKNMRLLLSGSEILDNCQKDRVQDAYAIRCIPQVHGAVRDALLYVTGKVNIELNAVTDNPIIFPDDEAVISGGNFHGEPMALPFDLMGIAASELANISERRIERMVNHTLSNGLPPFLTNDAGINSGYMIVQYAAASMVSENKVLAHPASVDSIPSSANQEDFVSMGTTAARKAGDIVQNTLSVLAYELMTACQAIDMRKQLNSHGQGITPFHKLIHDRIREIIPFYDKDREIWPDIRAIESFIRSRELLDMITEKMPDVHNNNTWL
ncbi:MAG: histidine ammonia-lyase [Lachnospiraceae bacterium]|nr:histidine ammonia-lyase [Lachnospiraceae bacterium]